MVALHNALHTLNEYANLLLVLVTIIYVVVNWRTLRALKQASLLEGKARHLEHIKERVAQPLLLRLDSEMNALQGRLPCAINIQEIHSLKKTVRIGEDQFERQRQIRPLCLETHNLSLTLYSDASKYHFPKEIESIERFRGDFQQFGSECAELAARWADEIASTSALRRGSAFDNMPGNYADSDLLVMECIYCMMQGLLVPMVEMRTSASGVHEVYGRTVSNVIATGDKEQLDAWLNSGSRLVSTLWSSNGFSKRATELKAHAGRVREALDRMVFTQTLLGDCTFVGGTQKVLQGKS